MVEARSLESTYHMSTPSLEPGKSVPTSSATTNLKGRGTTQPPPANSSRSVDTAISGMGGESTPAEVSGDGLASRARLGGGIGNLYPHASDWGSGAEVG